MKRRVSILATVLAGAALANGSGAAAQQVDDRKLTVMTRPHPELDPLGVRLGSLLLFPSLSLGGDYTDNVFKTRANAREDFVLHLMPAARLVSDWSNHELEVGLEADVATYADHGREDYEDVSGWMNGRFDVTRSTSLFAGVMAEALHEDRGSPDDAAGIRPTTYDRLTGNVGVSQRFNRVTIEAEARLVALDFDDTRTAGGGSVNNDDRDRDIYLGAARVAYEMVPDWQAFLRTRLNERSYHSGRDDLGFDRDSWGLDVAVGTEFDLTGVTYGEVHVGYRRQAYDDTRFDTLDGVSFGARLTSNVTPLTTLQLFVDREIEETSVTTAEGYWSTSMRFTADHELLRNFIISADLEYSFADYQGIDREDDVVGAGLKATYQMNRNVGITAGYEYEHRDSSGAASDEDYSENLILIRLNGRL